MRAREKLAALYWPDSASPWSRLGTGFTQIRYVPAVRDPWFTVFFMHLIINWQQGYQSKLDFSIAVGFQASRFSVNITVKMGVAYSSCSSLSPPLSLPNTTCFASTTTLLPHKSKSKSTSNPHSILFQTHYQKPTKIKMSKSSSSAVSPIKSEEIGTQEENSTKPMSDLHNIDPELIQRMVYDALVWSSIHGLLVGDKSVQVRLKINHVSISLSLKSLWLRKDYLCALFSAKPTNIQVYNTKNKNARHRAWFPELWVHHGSHQFPLCIEWTESTSHIGCWV